MGDAHACRRYATLAGVTTLVFVHAHPDDEALLTAGTMARASAEGHRVVLITATDGAAGRTDESFAHGLADHRQAELMKSAAILNTAAVYPLGYADSGLTGQVREGFAQADLKQVSARIAQIVDAEGAEVLIGYDPAGGYGHPDHLRVHEVTRLVWEMGHRRMRLFEATLPREPIVAAVNTATRLGITPKDFDPQEFAHAWTPRAEITHRVNVKPFAKAKQQSMRAHASQQVADGGVRTLGVLGSLPSPAFRALLGREYYVAIR